MDQDNFIFTDKAKRFTFLLMGVGALALVYGIISIFITHDEHHHHLAVTRLWDNILINGFFFFAIGLAAAFFMAVQYAAESAWSTVLKRLFEAVGGFMPYGALVLVLVWIAGSLHFHHIYHWMDPDLFDPNSPHYDPIIAGKEAYLNLPFFWARAILFLGVWMLMFFRIRKRSREEDTIGGTNIHFKNVRDSAIFLVFFGFTSMVASWDWLMSIDTHWFSTLFGWYMFSGMWISAMTFITLLIIWLRGHGYLKLVNASHMHDMGKWMFAVSFLWTYLWFAQFMLIWYSNIPEEITYFQARIDDYPWIYYTMLLANFILPMLLLMSKDAKRNKNFLMGVGCIIFFFHWVDVYMMVTPGTMKGEGYIGPLEIGLFLGFLGVFLFVVLGQLTKAPLTTKKHPFLEESVHHHI